MRADESLSKEEAERLLAFCNNSGPLFITGAVAVGMFNMPQMGLILLVCHIAACITVGMLFRFYKRNTSHRRKVPNTKSKPGKGILKRSLKEFSANLANSATNPGAMFGEAIKSSMTTILAVGGFILFFSVLINLLLETGFIYFTSDIFSALLSPLGISRDLVVSLISGFFEITTGTNMTGTAQGVSLVQQLTAASMIIGWAGLSVHSQVVSIVSTTDISVKPYLLGKCLQGLIAGLYTYGFLKLVYGMSTESKPVFFMHASPLKYEWYGNLLNSSKLFLLCTALFIICGLIVALKDKLAYRRT